MALLGIHPVAGQVTVRTRRFVSGYLGRFPGFKCDLRGVCRFCRLREKAVLADVVELRVEYVVYSQCITGRE